MWSISEGARTGRALACALAFAAGISPIAAQEVPGDREAGFHAFLDGLRPRAVAMGIHRATLDAVLPTLNFNPRVIDLDRAQPGTDPNAPPPKFAPYYRSHVDAARIARGRSAYAANRSRLARIEAETGVPGSIMVSIWGNETNYGAYTGNFDLLRSLSSLAYDGRRRELFAGEFLATLKMVDQGVPRDQLKGSWAGATGNPQFLPSIYLRVARDGDGDGRADIWNSSADTLASIASYFRDAGWRRGQPWGFAVDVPAGFDEGQVANRLVSPRCPRVFARASGWRTMAEWRAFGVVPQSASWPGDRVQATLFRPDGPGQPTYLLMGNYRVILDYNCSNFYALSVGLLADAIVR